MKFSLYIFEKNKEIRLKWQKRLEYIMIDEFQDIDKIQYQLMKVLCGYHKNLFIVGDPDQTIYSWRGADINYLLNFDKAFPDVKTIMMNENYRSTPQILSVCNSLIDKNKNRMKKDLLPMCHSKNSVLYYHGDTSEEESDWIAEQIIKLHKRRRFTMEYKRFGSKIIVRIDKDEEILEKVKELALKENIRLAAVQALGATNSFTVGVYNVAEKKYYANTFSGSFEIVSLTGTINTMNGEFYTHLHISAGNDKG